MPLAAAQAELARLRGIVAALPATLAEDAVALRAADDALRRAGGAASSDHAAAAAATLLRFRVTRKRALAARIAALAARVPAADGHDEL